MMASIMLTIRFTWAASLLPQKNLMIPSNKMLELVILQSICFAEKQNSSTLKSYLIPKITVEKLNKIVPNSTSIKMHPMRPDFVV